MSGIERFCPLWGEWEPDSRLGEGSFGTVWKMRRRMIGNQYFYAAVKHISIPKDQNEIQYLMDEGVFTSEASATRYYDQILQSLVDEINTMHNLQGYTNIVSYEDHKILPKEGGIGYDLFLRMELLTPLTVRMRQPMTVGDVVRLGRDIAEAIDVLNRHHMVHRDIKPQNIFVNKTGDYKLGDYGTARALDSDATAMSRKGTFNYMAPEIYNNQLADIRVDIYSLGLVMYRLLNGNRLPFLPLTGDISSAMNESAVLKRMTGEEVPPPHYADKELSRIVLKACAFHPADRYQNAEELKKDLERYKGKETDLEQDEDEDRTIYDSHQFQFGTSGGQARESGSFSGSRSGTGRKAEAKEPSERSVGRTGQTSGAQKAEASVIPPEKTGREKPKQTTEPEKKGKGKILAILLAVAVLAVCGLVYLIVRPNTPETEQNTETAAVTAETEPAAESAANAAETEDTAETEDAAGEATETAITETVTAEETVPDNTEKEPEPEEAAEAESTPTPSPEPEEPTPEPETPTPEPEPETPTPVPVLSGDANGDGEVNSKDVIRLQKYVSGWDVVINEAAADVNGDGDINSKDVVRLAKIVSGQ